MSNKADRVPANVPGPWYVDSTCIACAVCTGDAPSNFAMADDGSSAYVFKQPSGPEIAQAATAMGDCPVQAIGNDG
jgi:ferredoxin